MEYVMPYGLLHHNARSREEDRHAAKGRPRSRAPRRRSDRLTHTRLRL